MLLHRPGLVLLKCPVSVSLSVDHCVSRSEALSCFNRLAAVCQKAREPRSQIGRRPGIPRHSVLLALLPLPFFFFLSPIFVPPKTHRRWG